ncbi:hypothetical protein PR003_g31220 [Phytophthora rubi]|uniref:Secreted protein n=1 Tax=Phytophthora rubi TaxID=129364 RepID=A0A6A3JKU5_9STRA|nr:hypothetical protein PR002_g27155 [Phytophthora rubi]KAE8992353.1 hypothetical protein PR001_g20962 [Phytophthora rubi]KAE9269167.1 hypothetical protein PR003_g31220 [Phytophthora rubi]
MIVHIFWNVVCTRFLAHLRCVVGFTNRLENAKTGTMPCRCRANEKKTEDVASLEQDLDEFFKSGTSCATNRVLLIRQTTPRSTSVASRFNVAWKTWRNRAITSFAGRTILAC